MEDAPWLNWQLQNTTPNNGKGFSSEHKKLFKIDYFLSHKTSLKKFQKSKIIQVYSLAAVVLNYKSIIKYSNRIFCSDRNVIYMYCPMAVTIKV